VAAIGCKPFDDDGKAKPSGLIRASNPDHGRPAILFAAIAARTGFGWVFKEKFTCWKVNQEFKFQRKRVARVQEQVGLVRGLGNARVCPQALRTGSEVPPWEQSC
jgi:hypothetical protein